MARSTADILASVGAAGVSSSNAGNTSTATQGGGRSTADILASVGINTSVNTTPSTTPQTSAMSADAAGQNRNTTTAPDVASMLNNKPETTGTTKPEEKTENKKMAFSERLAEIRRQTAEKNKESENEAASILANISSADVPAQESAQQKATPNYGKGNIDLNARPTVENEDGTISTVDSTSFNIDGKEVLIPTVINVNGQWKHVEPEEALQHYYQTGEYLGKFDTVAEADAYAEQIHLDQEAQYAPSTQSEGKRSVLDILNAPATTDFENTLPNHENIGRQGYLMQDQSDVLVGTLQNAGSAALNTISTAMDSGSQAASFRPEEIHAAAQAMGIADEEAQAVYQNSFAGKVANSELHNSIDSAVSEAAKSLQSTSDNLYAEGAGRVENVKSHQTAAANFVTDLCVQAINMGTDAILSYGGMAIGLPPLGIVNMASRSFGDAAREVRANGGDVNDQMLSGFKAASIEILTEKIGGPFEKIYGKTALGKFAGEAIEKLSKSPAWKAALTALSNFSSEFTEEFLSDILNPLADRLLGLYNGYQSLLIEYGENLGQYLYDGLVGGLMGLIGSVPGFTSGNLTEEQVKAIVAKSTDEVLANEQITKTEAGTKPVDADLADVNQPSAQNAAETVTSEVSQEAINAIEEILTRQEGITEQQARVEIVKNPEMRAAFEQVTGISLEGMSNNKASKTIVENFGNASESLVAASEATQQESNQITQEKPQEQNLAASEELNSQSDVYSENESTEQTITQVEEPTQQENVVPQEQNSKSENVPAMQQPSNVSTSATEEISVPGSDIQNGGGGLPPSDGATQQKGKISQTSSHTLTDVAEALGTTHDLLTYIPRSEAETLAAAVARVNANGTSEMDSLLANDGWSADDVDTAMTIYGLLCADDVNNGTHNAQSWARVVQQHGTKTAQALQAFAKWTRSGRGQAARIDENLADAVHNGDITQEQANEIRNEVQQWADTIDEASNSGDIRSIRDVILAINRFRGTGTFIARNFENILNDINDIDYLTEFALRQMMASVDDYTVSANIGQRLKTWQTLAQLTRLPTFFRNILGNASFSPIDMFANNGIGVMLDSLASVATGNREVAWRRGGFSRVSREASLEAFRRSVLEVAGDVNMNGEGGRYGTNSSRTNKMTGGMVERAMSRWEQLLNYMLTTSDRVARGGIEGSVSQGLRNAGVTEENAQILASNIADYDLFQNRGITAQSANTAHDFFNLAGVGGEVQNGVRRGGFGVGDFVMPYATVPANLAVKAAEFSPANIIKGGIEFVNVLRSINNGTYQVGQQQQAVMDISRGMVGVPIIALLVSAFKTGIIKNFDDEDDKDAAYQKKAEGKSGVQINLDAFSRWLEGDKATSAEWQEGDTMMNIGFLEPANAFMAIASLIANDQEEDDKSVNWVRNYAQGTLQATLEMPVMQALNDIYTNIKYAEEGDAWGTVEKVGVDIAKNAVSGMIPAPLSQTAKTLDVYQRNTVGDSDIETAYNSIISNIPGLRETLPIKTDSYGQNMTYAENDTLRALNNFLLPGTLSENKQTPLSAEASRLHDEVPDEDGIFPKRNAPNSVKSDGVKYELSAEEKREYQDVYGSAAGILGSFVINSPEYNRLGTEMQAEVLGEINDFATKAATGNLIASRDGYYTGQDKVDEVLAMKPDEMVDFFVDSVKEENAKSDLSSAIRSSDTAALNAAQARLFSAGYTSAQVKTAITSTVKDLYTRTGSTKLAPEKALESLSSAGYSDSSAKLKLSYWDYEIKYPESEIAESTYNKLSSNGVTDDNINAVYSGINAASKRIGATTSTLKVVATGLLDSKLEGDQLLGAAKYYLSETRYKEFAKLGENERIAYLRKIADAQKDAKTGKYDY